MAQAIWNGEIIAESDECEIVEGNVYFPPVALRRQYFRDSEHTSHCHWKGKAHYYDVVVNDEINTNAAWFYPEPKPAAENIRNHVAFWNGVDVKR